MSYFCGLKILIGYLTIFSRLQKLKIINVIIKKKQAGEYEGNSLDDIAIDIDEHFLLNNELSFLDVDTNNEEPDVIPENLTEEEQFVHKKLDDFSKREEASD